MHQYRAGPASPGPARYGRSPGKPRCAPSPGAPIIHAGIGHSAVQGPADRRLESSDLRNFALVAMLAGSASIAARCSLALDFLVGRVMSRGVRRGGWPGPWSRMTWSGTRWMAHCPGVITARVAAALLRTSVLPGLSRASSSSAVRAPAHRRVPGGPGPLLAWPHPTSTRRRSSRCRRRRPAVAHPAGENTDQAECGRDQPDL
jgi:hypothetical protein